MKQSVRKYTDAYRLGGFLVLFFGVFFLGGYVSHAQNLTSNGPISFGSVDIGKEEWKTVNLTNTADNSDLGTCTQPGRIWVNSIKVDPPFSTDGQCAPKGMNTSGDTQTCSFKVFFKPTTAGTFDSSITIQQAVAIAPNCSVAKALSIDVSGTGKGTEPPPPPPSPPTPPPTDETQCTAESGRKGTCKTSANCTGNNEPEYSETCANLGNNTNCCVPKPPQGDPAKTCSEQGGTCGTSACTGEEIMHSKDCDSEGQHCCKTPAATQCDAANCKAKESDCANGTNPACAQEKCKEPAKPVYCNPASTPPPGGGTAPQIQVIEFKNPLQFNIVEALLTSILSALRGVIVTLSIIFIVIGAVLYITSAGSEKQSGMAKKAITASMIGLAIGIAAPSFLKEIYKILSADQTLPSEAAAAPSIATILGNTLSFLLGIVGVLALIMLVVGGAIFLTASGDEKKLDTGKKIFKYALLGIIVALAALVITGQIADFFATS